MRTIGTAIRLSLSFLRIPRLFGFLFLFPLVLSVILVQFQLVVSGLYLSSTMVDAKGVKSSIERSRDDNFVRSILLGSGGPLDPIQVCRWKVVAAAGPGERKNEYPPEGCQIERFDAAIRVPDNRTADVSTYVEIFDGNFKRLHVCHSCQTDVIIDTTDPEQVRTDAKSYWGLLLLNLAEFSKGRIEHVVKVHEERDRIKSLLGTRYLHAQGFRKPTNISDVSKTLILVSNVTLLIIIALWLALKAHRKVLDYFSTSGALLPMVAATGKSAFYMSIWILTGLRVLFFLAASIPSAYIALQTSTASDMKKLFFEGNALAFVLWVMALASALSLATLIASIAELKHRHGLLSFVYRYVPLLVSLVGGLVWGLTFFIEVSGVKSVRMFIGTLPLVGIAPTLLAPVFEPPDEVLVIHALLTTGLIVLILRSNTRWFAAHLEEI